MTILEGDFSCERDVKKGNNGEKDAQNTLQIV